jgi:N-acetylneuraminic acid mutarotase
VLLGGATEALLRTLARLASGRSIAGALVVALTLNGCGGGGSSYGGGGGTPATYSVGGTITGLTAAGLQLANGSDTASPVAGTTSFTFASALTSGLGYTVTIKTQPSGETCKVSGGSGTVGEANVTSVQVRCVANTYSVGGAITGLWSSGLVLANGNDTVSAAPGATNFTFATPVASGMTYAVSIHTPANGQICQVTSGTGTVSAAAVTTVVVACERAWAWVSGANTTNAAGVYGRKGVAAAGTVPGARNGSCSWIDNMGNLWLFGGNGYDSAGTQDLLNDLWRYSRRTGQWTWVSGSSTHIAAQAVYGSKGMTAAATVPGARTCRASWTDSAGNLWLFGGLGLDSLGASGDLNDLWRYSPETGQWTWVSGSSKANAAGVYGNQNVAASANVPGARDLAVTWTDGLGNLWLFGGSGYDSAGTSSGWLNDLWRYSPDAGQWTWVSGSSTHIAAQAVYGSKGMAAAANVPGARDGSASWIDSAGNLWLFGGIGTDSTGAWGFLNDLWRYSPDTSQWTWVSGSDRFMYSLGAYGTQGIAAPDDVPGSRTTSVSWTDSAGNLWLFGGRRGFSFFNDVWRYSPGTDLWTWVSGSSMDYAKGMYGTPGTAAPGNAPGARFDAVSWTDSAGNIWLFGGIGYSASAPGHLNDLWVY